MATEHPNTQDTKYKMTWDEAYERVQKRIIDKLASNQRVYGIPRGGVYVAAMSGHATDHPKFADAFVDDIIDSGATAKKWRDKYHKPVLPLVDKQCNVDDKKMGWVVFPWEVGTVEEIGPVKNAERILQHIGEDITRPGLIETPARMIKALEEMTSGYNQNPKEIIKLFEKDGDEMITVTGIQFTSLCEHHVLPFTGTAVVGYIPEDKMVGLSKIPRLVLAFAKRLQTQERLTAEIAEAFDSIVEPLGVGVILKAHHSCMGCRGVVQPSAQMITSSMLGAMRDNPTARSELLSLIK